MAIAAPPLPTTPASAGTGGVTVAPVGPGTAGLDCGGAGATAGERSVVDVLASAREHRQAANAHEALMLVDVVEWAALHPVDADGEAAGWRMNRVGFDPQIAPLNADGVPEVDASAVAELGTALRISTHTAHTLLAHALELAYRLPTLWARVIAGEVPVWRARKIAEATSTLTAEAAGWVDRQTAPFAHRVSFSGLDRLVKTAMLQYDPDQYWANDAEQREPRHVLVDIPTTTMGGMTTVHGRIDLADALDLDQALNHAAAQRAAWGDTATQDARRARSLGDLAREHLQLTDLTPHSSGPVEISTEAPLTRRGTLPSGAPLTITPVGETCNTAPRNRPLAGITAEPGFVPRHVKTRRQVVLYVHLTAADLTANDLADANTMQGVGRFGRVENTRAPVTTDTIREWCGAPDTSITVRTVIDPAAEYSATGYAIPDRLREQIRLRDQTCVFPGCDTNGLSCQVDHIEPFDQHTPSAGGQTTSSNLALLCQRHHHLKTFAPGWTYQPLGHGYYQWTTPTGQRVLREPHPESHTYTPTTSPPER